MNTEQQILQYACDLLSRREHSRVQLRQKLLRRGHDAALVETLLLKLTDKKLQDDTRFTENFIYARINKGQGPLKIRQALHDNGVEQSLIDHCLEAVEIDWLVLANKVREKRFGPNLPKEYNEKMKQCRFLYGRGFDSARINSLFR